MNIIEPLNLCVTAFTHNAKINPKINIKGNVMKVKVNVNLRAL